jgi:hypothetical protein
MGVVVGSSQFASSQFLRFLLGSFFNVCCDVWFLLSSFLSLQQRIGAFCLSAVTYAPTSKASAI